MTRTVTFQSFLQLALSEFGTIPKHGLIGLGIAGGLVGVSDFIFWSHRPHVLPIDYALFVALIVGWSVLLYAISMMMLDHRPSVSGFVRFAITSVAMFLPAVIALGFLWFASLHSNGLGLILAVALLVGSLIFTALLPGWPVMQAKSRTLIGPLVALKSTRGIRWALVLVALATSALNRASPEISSTDGAWSALLFAALGGLLAMLSAMIAISIAVTSAKLMLAE